MVDTADTARLRQHVREFKHEHEAAQAIASRDWPSDADLAAMVSSGAIEGKARKPRKQTGLGLLFVLLPWILIALFFLGYHANHIVQFFARIAGH